MRRHGEATDVGAVSTTAPRLLMRRVPMTASRSDTAKAHELDAQVLRRDLSSGSHPTVSDFIDPGINRYGQSMTDPLGTCGRPAEGHAPCQVGIAGPGPLMAVHPQREVRDTFRRRSARSFPCEGRS